MLYSDFYIESAFALHIYNGKKKLFCFASKPGCCYATECNTECKCK